MRGRREPGAKGPAGATEALTAWPYRLGLSFYRLGISAFFAGGGLCWLRKKYKTGLEQRVGNISGVPKGALWVHAVSVGEVQSALPLVGEAEKRLPCVLSTVTATGRGMAERLMPGTPMIYNPWDVPRFVSRALDALSPRAYAAMETERWPALLAELRARGIPAFLVNGRLSEGSARRLSGQRAFWRGVLCCFEKLLVRFESDKERFLGLGVPEGKIAVTGDCKVDAMFARKAGADAGKWSRLRRGDAPLFLAGSTHPGEDEIVLEAFRRVRERHPRARLVVAPRHPERAASVAELARSALAPGRTRVSPLSDAVGDWDVSVVDRVGVLFELYPAADAAFVGGSLVPKGGQNLMEPALFGIQTTHGPDMSDFPDAPRMDKMGASLEIRDAPALARAWIRSLEPAERSRAEKACERYFDTVRGAGARGWKMIEPYL